MYIGLGARWTFGSRARCSCIRRSLVSDDRRGHPGRPLTDRLGDVAMTFSRARPAKAQRVPEPVSIVLAGTDRPRGSSPGVPDLDSNDIGRHMKSTLRMLLCTAISLCVAPAQAQPAQPKSAATTTTTVVFVCEHGAAKSVIAAAHFNRLATERGLPIRAVSRATKPDDVVAPGVRTGLASDGIDVSAWRPTAVSDQDIRQATRVVSLATDLPTTKPLAKSKLLEWNDIPPVSENYDAARTAIVEEVRKLLDNLSKVTKK